jgi:hypothetical protein
MDRWSSLALVWLLLQLISPIVNCHLAPSLQLFVVRRTFIDGLHVRGFAISDRFRLSEIDTECGRLFAEVFSF